VIVSISSNYGAYESVVVTNPINRTFCGNDSRLRKHVGQPVAQQGVLSGQQPRFKIMYIPLKFHNLGG